MTKEQVEEAIDHLLLGKIVKVKTDEEDIFFSYGKLFGKNSSFMFSLTLNYTATETPEQHVRTVLSFAENYEILEDSYVAHF